MSAVLTTSRAAPWLRDAAETVIGVALFLAPLAAIWFGAWISG